jgi:hypothetical protein
MKIGFTQDRDRYSINGLKITSQHSFSENVKDEIDVHQNQLANQSCGEEELLGEENDI